MELSTSSANLIQEHATEDLLINTSPLLEVTTSPHTAFESPVARNDGPPNHTGMGRVFRGPAFTQTTASTSSEAVAVNSHNSVLLIVQVTVPVAVVVVLILTVCLRLKHLKSKKHTKDGRDILPISPYAETATVTITAVGNHGYGLVGVMDENIYQEASHVVEENYIVPENLPLQQTQHQQNTKTSSSLSNPIYMGIVANVIPDHYETFDKHQRISLATDEQHYLCPIQGSAMDDESEYEVPIIHENYEDGYLVLNTKTADRFSNCA